jgi:polysaccharide export outer membrane protein
MLPPPVETYELGPGDRFEIIVIGDNSFPKDYTIAPDGTVDFPLLHRQPVAGFEAQALASHLRQLLIDGKFYRDPVIIITPREFNSRRITVSGAVVKPGDMPFTTGMTLMRLITSAGGFSASANKSNVLVTRKLAGGERRSVSFAVGAIEEGRAPDVPLQSGDSVFVYERPFLVPRAPTSRRARGRAARLRAASCSRAVPARDQRSARQIDPVRGQALYGCLRSPGLGPRPPRRAPR